MTTPTTSPTTTPTTVLAAWAVVGAALQAEQLCLAPSRDGGWLLLDAGDTIVARADTISALAAWVEDRP